LKKNTKRNCGELKPINPPTGHRQSLEIFDHPYHPPKDEKPGTGKPTQRSNIHAQPKRGDAVHRATMSEQKGGLMAPDPLTSYVYL